MMKIYVASPYSADPDASVYRADKVTRCLVRAGHLPFSPAKHAWGWEKDAELRPRDWWKMDVAMILDWADALVRVPGPSRGADIETALAEQVDLVVYSCRVLTGCSGCKEIEDGVSS